MVPACPSITAKPRPSTIAPRPPAFSRRGHCLLRPTGVNSVHSGEDAMNKTIITIAAVLGFAATPALAENWNVVSRSSATVFMVDVDAITQAGDAITTVLARVPASGPANDLSYSAGEITIRCA